MLRQIAVIARLVGDRRENDIRGALNDRQQPRLDQELQRVTWSDEESEDTARHDTELHASPQQPGPSAAVGLPQRAGAVEQGRTKTRGRQHVGAGLKPKAEDHFCTEASQLITTVNGTAADCS